MKAIYEPLRSSSRQKKYLVLFNNCLCWHKKMELCWAQTEDRKSWHTFERAGIQTLSQRLLFLIWTRQCGKIKNSGECYGGNTWINKHYSFLSDHWWQPQQGFWIYSQSLAWVCKHPIINSQCSVTLIISALVTHHHSFTILLSQGYFQTYNLTKPESVRAAPADFTFEFEFRFLQ